MWTRDYKLWSFFSFPFFPYNGHSSSKDMLDMLRVKHLFFHVQSITSRNEEVRP